MRSCCHEMGTIFASLLHAIGTILACFTVHAMNSQTCVRVLSRILLPQHENLCTGLGGAPVRASVPPPTFVFTPLSLANSPILTLAGAGLLVLLFFQSTVNTVGCWLHATPAQNGNGVRSVCIYLFDAALQHSVFGSGRTVWCRIHGITSCSWAGTAGMLSS